MEEKISDLSNSKVSLSTPWEDARKRLANFMSYDINKKIIEASVDYDDSEIIKNWLNNSVSEEYISDALDTLEDIFEKVKKVNSWLFTIMFTILPSAITYFISPFCNKLKPGSNANFIELLPITIVSMAIPAISAFLITCFLNQWFVDKDRDILKVWSKKRNLLMKVPFTDNKSFANRLHSLA